MSISLYLGSTSQSRQMLLRQANIPFIAIPQYANESSCDWNLPLEKLVASIALYKMDHVQLPKGKEGDEILVLTGDTLGQNKGSGVEGKPIDKDDAIRKIKAARTGTKLCSAFCLHKKKFKNGSWHTIERIQEVVCSEYLFVVPDEWIESYLKHSIGLTCSNAIAIEGYGEQFLQKINGSYSAIVGLPLFELRKALEKFGFFNQ